MSAGLSKFEVRILLLLVMFLTVGMGIRHFSRTSSKNIEIISRDRNSEIEITDPDNKNSAETPMTEAVSNLIDINNAGADDLRLLKGIGPAKADEIIRHRQETGKFREIDDLLEVKGIGPATYDGIKDQVTVGNVLIPGSEQETPQPCASLTPENTPSLSLKEAQKDTFPGRVNINLAGREELMTLNGIGKTLSLRIIDYRKSNGPFRRPEDIQNVKGIGKKTFLKNRNMIIVKDQGTRE